MKIHKRQGMKSKVLICMMVVVFLLTGCDHKEEHEQKIGEKTSAEVLDFGSFQMAGFDENYYAVDTSTQDQVIYEIYTNENQKTDTFTYRKSEQVLLHDHIKDLALTKVVSHMTIQLHEETLLSNCQIDRTDFETPGFYWIGNDDPIKDSFSKEGDFPASSCTVTSYGVIGTNDQAIISKNEELPKETKWDILSDGITYDYEDAFLYQIIEP